MQQPEIIITLAQLRGMIGINVNYRGVACRIVEVLEDGPALALQDLGQSALQADQYGDPHRRVPETYSVPILNADRQTLHPDFLGLDLLELRE